MAATCSKSCLSILLLISNVLFCIIGILTLVGGVWLIQDEGSTGDIAFNMVENIEFNENELSNVNTGFREIFDNDSIWYWTIGFGVASILTSLSGLLRFKIGSNRLFCLVMHNLVFSILLFTLHIAVVAKLHQRNVDIEELKDLHDELRNLDTEELEGSGPMQSVLFGVLIAMSCGLGILEFIILIEVIESK